MKVILLAGTLLAATVANADVYPVLENYRAVATRVVELAQSAKAPVEIQTLKFATRDLVTYGQEIACLYAMKNPNCATQMQVFLEAVPTMESMSLEDVDRLYHDGAGLPTAPKHCYLGRSQAVHPMMNLIRLQGELTDGVRDEIVDESQEVIEHLGRIQKNLDNPPN